MITQDTVEKLLRYNAVTGEFHWKKSSGSKSAGSVASHVGKLGYVQIRIDGVLYYAHRLAWLVSHGCFPTAQIDHINHNRSDNRLCNLREVSHAENQRNKGMNSRNKSGVTGVFWDFVNNKWKAQIKFEGKVVNLGRFSAKTDAIAARTAAEAKANYHPNHGIGERGRDC
jgi:hypothetical protein